MTLEEKPHKQFLEVFFWTVKREDAPVRPQPQL